MDFSLEVKERDPASIRPPSPPKPSSASGFPEHKRRTKVSAFKQRQQGNDAASMSRGPGVQQSSSPRDVSGPKTAARSEMDERREIDRENRRRIAAMSPEEIAEAQQELFNGLDPKIIQMLLRRANLDEQQDDSVFGPPAGPPPKVTVEDTSEPAQIPEKAKEQPSRSSAEKSSPTDAAAPASSPSSPSSVSKGEPARDASASPRKASVAPPFDEDYYPTHPPADLPVFSPKSLASPSQLPPPKTIAQPLGSGRPSSSTSPAAADAPPSTGTAPEPPRVDINSPDFLSQLHDTYFPNLPADPTRLAWMAPLPTADSPADRESPYHPSQRSLAPSQLRFDFRGSLLAPRTSRSIPVTAGLHHHAEAPEAAGYTIPELARLARSAVPAQRCIAYQTLGRILFRLGQGEWGGKGGRQGPSEAAKHGREGEADEDKLALAIWQCMVEGRVIEAMTAEAMKTQGHQSARAYAVEALWLLEKGGWRERWKGR